MVRLLPRPRLNLRWRFLLVLLPVTLCTTLGMLGLARWVVFRSHEREVRASVQAEVLSHALPFTSRMHGLQRTLALLAEHGGEASTSGASTGGHHQQWIRDAWSALHQWNEVRELYCVHPESSGVRLTRISRSLVDDRVLPAESLPVWARWSATDVAACVGPSHGESASSIASAFDEAGEPILWMDHPFDEGVGRLGVLMRPSALAASFMAHDRDDGERLGEPSILVDARGRVVPTNRGEGPPPLPEPARLAELIAARSPHTTVIDFDAPGIGAHVAALYADPELGLGVIQVVPRSALAGAVARLDRLMLAVTLVGVLLAGVAILVLTRQVVVPIERLTRTMGDVARGDLSQRLPVEGSCEIAQLARTFNTMISDLHTTHVALRTQSSRLAEALREVEDVEAMKDSFLALVSHEVRTPLTSIMGGVEFLREEFAAQHDETQTEFMTIVYESARRLAGFMNDAIMMASLQASRSRSSFEFFSLTALLHGKFEEMVAPQREKGLNVENRMDAQREFFVLGDWTLMQVAIEKLLQNAVRHNRPGGRVVVEIVERVLEDDAGDLEQLMSSRGIAAPEPQMHWRAVRVFNTGPLIPEEKFAGLFARFELTHDIANHQRGSGLSLPIAHYVLAFHGGSVEVRQVADEGMAFYLVLPGRLSLQSRLGDAAAPAGVDDTVTTARLVESAAGFVQDLEASIAQAEVEDRIRRAEQGEPTSGPVSSVVAPVRTRLEEILIGHDPRVECAKPDPARD